MTRERDFHVAAFSSYTAKPQLNERYTLVRHALTLARLWSCSDRSRRRSRWLTGDDWESL